MSWIEDLGIEKPFSDDDEEHKAHELDGNTGWLLQHIRGMTNTDPDCIYNIVLDLCKLHKVRADTLMGLAALNGHTKESEQGQVVMQAMAVAAICGYFCLLLKHKLIDINKLEVPVVSVPKE